MITTDGDLTSPVLTVIEAGNDTGRETVLPDQRTTDWIVRSGRRHRRVHFSIPAAKRLTNIAVFPPTTHQALEVPLDLHRTSSWKVGGTSTTLVFRSLQTIRIFVRGKRPRGSPGETIPHPHHHRRNGKGHGVHHRLAALTTARQTPVIPVITQGTEKVSIEAFRSEGVFPLAVELVEDHSLHEGGDGVAAGALLGGEILCLQAVAGILSHHLVDGPAVHIRKIILREISVVGPCLATQRNLGIRGFQHILAVILWIQQGQDGLEWMISLDLPLLVVPSRALMQTMLVLLEMVMPTYVPVISAHDLPGHPSI